MNGRIYDYQSGRFLSVDPFISMPGSSQAYNPYSYVMNNPLSYTDPTGYFIEDLSTKSHSSDGGQSGEAGQNKPEECNTSCIDKKARLITQSLCNSGGKCTVIVKDNGAYKKYTANISTNQSGGSEITQKSLIVAITGGGGHKSGAGPDLLNLAKQYKDNEGVNIQTFEWDDSKAARIAIINFRKDNPEGRVVLMGYSLGGRAAVNIANKLGKKDIPIDSLITFDAYSYIGNSHKLRYNNVKQALNFYQQNPTDRSWGISPAGASNPYPGSVINSKHINIINRNYTSDLRGINHINIIDYAIRDYGVQINDYIK